MRNFIALLIVVFFLFSCSKKEKVVRQGYIVTSPEVAEIIVALGSEHNILAVTAECDFPPSLQKLPKIGNFGKINSEKIYEYNPEIIFISGLEQEFLAAELRKANFSIMQIYPSSIKEFFNAISLIGEKIMKRDEARKLRDVLQKELLKYEDARFSKIKPKVYMEIYGQPLMSVSDSSFVGELIELAGGDNIFNQLPREYARINPERILTANPDIIILTYPGITKKQIKTRKGWDKLSAVKKDQIYTVSDLDPDLILRASPRIVSGLQKLNEFFQDASQ